MEAENRKLKKLSIIGIFVIFALSVFWHFLFDLLPSVVSAAISPVNESLWEHTKLFFCPALIWYAIMYFAAGKAYPNFLFAHAIMLIIMPVVALLLHGAYRLFAPELLVADIIITFLAVALGSLAAYRLTVSRCHLSHPALRFAAVLIVIGLAAVFAVFTFCPPAHPLFISS